MDDATFARELVRRGIAGSELEAQRLLKLDEAKLRDYVRDRAGKFANVPGAGDDAPKTTVTTRTGTKVTAHPKSAPKGAKPAPHVSGVERGSAGSIVHAKGPKREVTKVTPGKDFDKQPMGSAANLSPEQLDQAYATMDSLTKSIPGSLLTELGARFKEYAIHKGAHHTAHGTDADEVVETLHRTELVAHELLAHADTLRELVSASIGLISSAEPEPLPSDDALLLRAQVAAGVGWPTHYLGDPDDESAGAVRAAS